MKKIKVCLRVLISNALRQTYCFSKFNYSIDLVCIGVDKITEVLVVPIDFILSITFSSSYISFTITFNSEQSSPVIYDRACSQAVQRKGL